jgi:hypothetical protein
VAVPELALRVNQIGTVVGSTTKASLPAEIDKFTGTAFPAVLGNVYAMFTEVGKAASGETGSVVVCACAKPAHRRSADAAREILMAEDLDINGNPFQNLVYGFDTLAALDYLLGYGLISPLSR